MHPKHLLTTLLILPLLTQAKTPNQAPAAQEQTAKLIREINQAAPIQSDIITIQRASQSNGHILIQASLDSKQLPLPSSETQLAPIRQALQTLTEAAWCSRTDFQQINPHTPLTTQYRSGSAQTLTITLPAGHCAQIQSSQNPEQQAENTQIASLTLLLPGINQRLPLSDGNLTLQRISFDHPTRTQHKYLTLNDPNLAKQTPAAIQTHIQNEARSLECEDPLLAQNNRYYGTTHHFTLPGHPDTFQATVPKNSCTQAPKPN